MPIACRPIDPGARLLLRRQGFPVLLAALSCGWFGLALSQLAFGWETQDRTHSALAVAGVFAVRMLPQVLLGVPAGALSDALGARRMLIASNALCAMFALVLAALVSDPTAPVWVLFLASAISGVLDAPRAAASQAFVVEVAGRASGTSALSLANLGAHLGGFAAGVGGALLVANFGFGVALATVAGGHAIASMLINSGHRPQPIPTSGTRSVAYQRHGLVGRMLRAGSRLWASGWNGVVANRWMRYLALAAVAIEVFAFSSLALLPVFADEVFAWGATGLGWMLAARSAGAVVGILALGRLRRVVGGGRLLLTLAAAFGISLIVFALGDSIPLALVMLGLAGFAGAAVDTLIQALLQETSPSGSRGTAMGVWVSAIGLAPIGHLEIGALATVLGAPVAQAANGFIVIAAAGLLALATPVRRLR